MRLRGYQTRLDLDIEAAWARGGKNILAILPTGGGKTVTFARVIHRNIGGSVAIAHRQELVGQISQALAREGVRHKIIGPENVVKACVKKHMADFGRSYYDPSANAAVAGVDTLVRRTTCRATIAWAQQVTLWVQDEAHHVLKSNKWGRAVEMFPNARGLGVTATPCRADGAGLGRRSQGVFDEMVTGPGMRDLINSGYLTDYRVIAPRTKDLDLSGVSRTAGGDYSQTQLVSVVRKSRLVGDVVEHYLRYANGKLGVTFATDVETATDIAARFNAAGIPAAIVHAGTSDEDRARHISSFARRELLQLVNVDLFGEGFDLPAIEVVSMARPTESYSLYAQQFGRALRLLISPDLHAVWEGLTPEQRLGRILESTKPRAVIIDHVGNVERHMLPDAERIWTLEPSKGEPSGRAKNEVPMRTCLNAECLAVYERTHPFCPLCGHTPVPARRTGPELVDGDLTELSEDALARLRGRVIDLASTFTPHVGVPHVANLANAKRHRHDIECQKALRESLAWWAGIQRRDGRSDRESMRKFYHTFGVDVLSAQALKAADALPLADKINQKIGEEL